MNPEKNKISSEGVFSKPLKIAIESAGAERLNAIIAASDELKLYGHNPPFGIRTNGRIGFIGGTIDFAAAAMQRTVILNKKIITLNINRKRKILFLFFKVMSKEYSSGFFLSRELVLLFRGILF